MPTNAPHASALYNDDKDHVSAHYASQNNHADHSNKYGNDNNNFKEVKGKFKKFMVARSSVDDGECGTGSPILTPKIVIESDTGDKEEVDFTSHQQHETAEFEEPEVTNPLLPKSALKRHSRRPSCDSGFESTRHHRCTDQHTDSEEQAFPDDCAEYHKRKRPSISFADDNDSDDSKSDRSVHGSIQGYQTGIHRFLTSMHRDSRRSSLAPSLTSTIPEEDVAYHNSPRRSHSYGNIVRTPQLHPKSVHQVERRQSIAPSADDESPHGSKSNLSAGSNLSIASDRSKRRQSRMFTVINYGDNDAAVPEDQEVPNQTRRRVSSHMTLPAITLSPEALQYHEQQRDHHYLDSNPYLNSRRGSRLSGTPITPYPQFNGLMSSKVRKSIVMDELSPVCNSIGQTSLRNSYNKLPPARHASIYTQTGISIPTVAKRGQLWNQRRTKRLVNKTGDFNIYYKNIYHKHFSYLSDIFTTILDTQWRYTFLLFVVCFCSSWLLFGCFWWLIAVIRGDNPDKGENNCVAEVYDFPTSLLFSIETQHTIGYGVRSMTVNCPEAVVLLMIQSLFGVIIQCVLAGCVLAKLARPKYRAETIMFSKQAVICQEDGEYCLLFRVGDMRRSQLVGAMLHAMFVKQRITQEGDEIPFYQYHLEVSAESEDYDQFIFLSWPIRVMHRINRASPLWGVDAETLLAEDFEIIVVLEGVVEATGMTTQVRTSYLPSEILWGHRLAPLLTLSKDNGAYEIDYGRFHETRPVDMPEYSASVMEEYGDEEEREDFQDEEMYESRRSMQSANSRNCSTRSEQHLLI